MSPGCWPSSAAPPACRRRSSPERPGSADRPRSVPGGNRDRIVAWIRASEADVPRDLTHNGGILRNGAQLVEAGVPPAPASTHAWGLFGRAYRLSALIMTVAAAGCRR